MTKKLTHAQRARKQRKQERRWAFITQAASEFESRPEAERQRLTARRQRRDACALSWEEQVEAARQRLRASIERLKQRKAYREQQETARALRAAKRDKGETVPAWRAAKDAPRRVAKLEQRKAYRGLRIFRSMLGDLDGTVIPPRTPTGNIPRTFKRSRRVSTGNIPVTRELCTPDDGSRRHDRPRPRFKRPQR